MAKVTVRNVSPLGDLELPTLGVRVAAGETFEVDAAVADVLTAQEHFQIVAQGKADKK